MHCTGTGKIEKVLMGWWGDRPVPYNGRCVEKAQSIPGVEFVWIDDPDYWLNKAEKEWDLPKVVNKPSYQMDWISTAYLAENSNVLYLDCDTWFWNTPDLGKYAAMAREYVSLWGLWSGDTRPFQDVMRVANRKKVLKDAYWAYKEFKRSAKQIPELIHKPSFL